MIDTQSEAGSWKTALAPTHPSLRVLSREHLHNPRLIEQVQRTHGTATLAEARDLIAAEIKRRTTTNGDG